MGRVVHILVDPATNNGSDVAPAVITRVWSDVAVNVRVLPDSNHVPAWRTSVRLHDERPAEAEVERDAWWPPRVS